MDFKSLSIGNQLFVGFAAIIFGVLLLGLVSYNQGSILHDQTDKLYNHPLVVRKAIADVELSITKMRLATRDFMLASNTQERERALLDGVNSEQHVELNFDILYKAYLGPKEDIDKAYIAFNVWNELRQKNIENSNERSIEQIKTSISNEGDVGKLRNDLLLKIKLISDYSHAKANSLYAESKVTARFLAIELIVIVSIIVILILIVSFYFVRRIRLPLKELEGVITAYQSGDLDVRSSDFSGNEIGILAITFNELLDSVKSEKIISEKISHISNSMLIEDNSHTFFKSLLPVLAVETNSQMAAVYILNDLKTEFKLYESIGLNASVENNCFSATNFQGEFGAALITKKIQFIKSIPIETRFVFNAVSGDMIPREIVTIPILVGNEVVAMVSLASLRTNTIETINLIYKIYDVLSARIDGILAYRNLRKSASQLRYKNIELEQQRNALNQQSTELAQQNGELEIQKNQLKEASRLKTTFLSNMSHELRTPLNSVIALSGVLNRRLQHVIPDDEYSYIGVIERNGRHLLTLINDILDISRIEAGREEVEVSEFDVNDLIKEVVELIQQQAKDRSIELRYHKTERILIQSDSKKVRHILQNLIANAVKFTEKGTVDIHVTLADNKVCFHIKDTGIGISSEHLKHIFDEFRQADSSTSRRFGGTGLGLAIAQKYARLLGGDIDVVSELNIGSQFTLFLPQYVGSNVIIQAPSRTFDSLINRNSMLLESKQGILVATDIQKSILLVDDSEPAIIQIKEMLEGYNYRVVIARSGTEALRLLSDFTPDAMILDLMMPQMDGFELLEKIRNFEKTKDAPVLILTAKHITKEDMKLLKNNHIHQLIQKGDVQREALVHAVNTMVSQPQKHLSLITENDTSPMHKVSMNKKLAVLIVEDIVDNLTAVKAVIGDKYFIYQALTGVEGIEMAQKIVPDFILIDISLPEQDGIQTFKQIRSVLNLRHIPIFALTASTMISDRETILAHGFEAYIPKPIDEKQFFEIINKVLYGK